jgi:ribosomal protein S18 acetylase RimI-like enzyme
MHVERAKLEDAHAIAEIHVLTWRAVYQGIVPADYLATLSVEKREALWRDSIAKGTPELWVAKTEGRVIGWVAFGPCRDKGTPPQVGEVWAIYVTASHWSSGVGRALWLTARERLQRHGYKSVSLWVLAENSRAIKFYLAAGFAPDLSSTKELTLGGKPLTEVRYEVEIDG